MALATLVPYQTLGRDSRVTGWYTDGGAHKSRDILRTAFEDAKTIFAQELTRDESKKAWVNSLTSLSDVESAVSDARAAYEITSHPKVNKWLAAFSTRIMYYAQIFDVLVQHHPEYVALAWGAFRFVFVVILNHKDLVTRLSKMLCRIADCLPQSNLCAILYPTNRMQEAVARLYAEIMRFMQSAISWYKKGRIMHAIGAILHPWELSFQNHQVSILAESARVKELASAATKAELRDTHLDVLDTAQDVCAMKVELQILLNENKRLAYLVDARFNILDQSITSITHQLRFGFREQKATLCTMQINQLLSLSFWEKLPTSGESLEFCRSMQQRKRDRPRIFLPEVSRLEEWAADAQSSLFLTCSGSYTAAKAFTVQLIDLVRTSGLPVIWVLRFPNYWESTMIGTDILRMLVFQALQINGAAQFDAPNPITAAHMHEAASEADWLRILGRALQGISRVFIIVDAILMAHVTQNDKHQATHLIESLRCGLPSSAKIFTAASSLPETYVETMKAQNDFIKLSTDGRDGARPTRGTLHRRQKQRRRARPVR